MQIKKLFLLLSLNELSEERVKFPHLDFSYHCPVSKGLSCYSYHCCLSTIKGQSIVTTNCAKINVIILLRRAPLQTHSPYLCIDL